MNYQEMIRAEIDYQRRRLYKRLKKADGRLIVEYWAGAKKFLNSVPGIKWEKQGSLILIKGEDVKMKTFKEILNETKPLQEGTWTLPFKTAQAKKLAKVMKKPVPSGDAGIKMLSGLIGDDSLFDDIESSSPLDGKKDDVRDIIRNWLADTLGNYDDDPSSFGDKLESGAEKILRKL